jgi:dephospho-CoA kinase
LLRLQERDDISAEVAQQKIDAQMPTARKVELATNVLRNDGSLEDLRADVRSLSEELKSSAKWHGRLLSPVTAGICLLAIVFSLTV